MSFRSAGLPLAHHGRGKQHGVFPISPARIWKRLAWLTLLDLSLQCLIFPTMVEGIRDDDETRKDFTVKMHIFYASRVENIHDDIQKFAGMNGQSAELDAEGNEIRSEKEVKKEAEEEKAKKEEQEKRKKDEDSEGEQGEGKKNKME